MKQVLLRRFGYDGLTLEECPEPDVGPRDVLLELRAVSLNRRDLMMIEGRYNPNQALPLVVTSDGVGEIVELGSEVRGLSRGDRVCPLFVQGWLDGPPSDRARRQTLGGPIDGTLREYMSVDFEWVSKVPEGLSDVEAATLPCAALTAFSALFSLGSLTPAATVLCLGTGGVSLFALQFAKALGARVVVTSRSDEKLERARALGADATINSSRCASLGKTVKEREGGVDHVIDVVGGNGFSERLEAVKPGGTVSLIGVLAGTQAKLDTLPIVMRQIRVQGVFVGHKRSFEAMARFIAEQHIEPVISEVFEFGDYVRALERLRGQTQLGKVCVKL